MKDFIIGFCALISGITLLSGCEKELMSYEGKDSIYFDVRRGASWIEPSRWAHQFYTTVSFGNLVENEADMTLKVMTAGLIKDYDRAFTVTVNNDSTTAIMGSDFENFKKEYVIRSGETSAIVSFKVHRTTRMNGDTLQLQLQLHENEHFNLMYTNFGDYPHAYSPEINKKFDYNKDASIHNLFIYDVLSRPAVWSGNDVTGTGLFGKFSAKKFRLMMELSNTTIEDYKSTDVMPTVRQTAIGELMAKHLLEKAKAKTPVIDEDGTMMWFMAINSLGGSDAWKPFTKWEDYNKNK